MVGTADTNASGLMTTATTVNRRTTVDLAETIRPSTVAAETIGMKALEDTDREVGEATVEVMSREDVEVYCLLKVVN